MAENGWRAIVGGRRRSVGAIHNPTVAGMNRGLNTLSMLKLVRPVWWVWGTFNMKKSDWERLFEVPRSPHRLLSFHLGEVS